MTLIKEYQNQIELLQESSVPSRSGGSGTGSGSGASPSPEEDEEALGLAREVRHSKSNFEGEHER